MHGVIDNVRPRLGADLERSNPERPWRILHANLAITAIRTEDAVLIDAALRRPGRRRCPTRRPTSTPRRAPWRWHPVFRR
jgi:hypothetical protein